MTKPIIIVKVPCNLLYIIQLMVAYNHLLSYNAASYWPCTFYSQAVFLNLRISVVTINFTVATIYSILSSVP